MYLYLWRIYRPGTSVILPIDRTKQNRTVCQIQRLGLWALALILLVLFQVNMNLYRICARRPSAGMYLVPCSCIVNPSFLSVVGAPRVCRWIVVLVPVSFFPFQIGILNHFGNQSLAVCPVELPRPFYQTVLAAITVELKPKRLKLNRW